MRLIVDANGLLYRSAFGLDLSTISGRRVGGVFGFLDGIEKILQATEADELTVCWDGGHSKRNDLYPEYKANRKRTPEVVEMICDQRSLLVRVLSLLPVVQVWEPDVEADDAIGIISSFTHLEHVGIVTGDSDLYQLATDRHRVLDFKGRRVELKHRPSRYLAEKVLVGDTSDNIKGVDQIGPVTAGKLLDQHKTLKGVLRATKASGKLGAMVWSEAVAVVKRNLQLMRVAHMVTEQERRSILDQYRHGRRHLLLDERRLRTALMELEFTSVVSRLSAFLASFRPLVRDNVQGEADAKAEQYRARVREAFAESASASQEGAASEASVKRIRRVVRASTTGDEGATRTGGEGRRETTFVRRVRKEAPVGAPAYGKRRGAKGAVRSDHGPRATDDGGSQPAVEARRGRTRKPLAGLLDSPEVHAKRKLRRDGALSVLSSLQRDEGWLKRQPTAVLHFVSTVIQKISEDDLYAPSKKELQQLERVHQDFLSEPPDWMKSIHEEEGA